MRGVRYEVLRSDTSFYLIMPVLPVGSQDLTPRFVTHSPTKKRLSTIAKAYDPPRTTSKGVYSYISDHIKDWIDEAIQIRKDNE